MFRLRESIDFAKKQGRIKKRAEIAVMMWEKSSYKSSYMNLMNLISGRSKKIDIDSVDKLCTKLGVTADYLFGRTDTPTQDDYRNEVAEKAKAIIKIAETL